MEKRSLLKETIQHIDIRSFDARPIIEAYGHMAFQARNLHSASRIFSEMLHDDPCTIMLTLAGSLFSVGLKGVVTAEVLGSEQPMHKYALQITVADERDGGLSGSTLREACSWGKVDTGFEQMVWCEATLAFPLLISDAYHREHWKRRTRKRYQRIFSG